MAPLRAKPFQRNLLFQVHILLLISSYSHSYSWPSFSLKISMRVTSFRNNFFWALRFLLYIATVMKCDPHGRSAYPKWQCLRKFNNFNPIPLAWDALMTTHLTRLHTHSTMDHASRMRVTLFTSTFGVWIHTNKLLQLICTMFTCSRKMQI